MPNNNCPECGNLVAYSAKKCPNCGNRNFICCTDSFVDVCETCEGSGRHYFHRDHVVLEETCNGCSGRGYINRTYRHDCRDFEEWDRLWNLARKKAKQNNEIIRAIEDQEYNQIFADRDGRLRSDLKRAADFRYRGDAILNVGRDLDQTKAAAWTSFQRGCPAVVAVWLVVGMGGCLIRVAANGSNPPSDVHSAAYSGYITAPFSAFFFEAIVAGVLALALNALVLVGRLSSAQSKHDKLMKVLNFDNMERIQY